MKHKTIIGLVVILEIVLLGAIHASGYHGINACQNVDIEKVKQFQKATISIRDELVIKRLELRKGFKQPTPNSDRISKLKREIRDLRVRIKEAANKSGVDLCCVKRRYRLEGKEAI